MCELAAADYEAKPRYETVDRQLVTRDLNMLKDKLDAAEVKDEAMLGLVRAELLFVKPERGDWKMPAGMAALGFRRLAMALEARDVERMEKTHVLKKMLEVRAWTYANDMKKPSQDAQARKKNPGDAEEASLGHFLTHWKIRKGYGEFSISDCLLIMRNVPWWYEFVNGSNAKKGADTEASLMALMADGFGIAGDPRGKKVLKPSEYPKEYAKLRKLRDGQFDEPTVDRILAPLACERRNYYKDEGWAARRAKAVVKKAESKVAEKERGHANGVKPGKKRQREEEAGPSVEDEDEEDEDE